MSATTVEPHTLTTPAPDSINLQIRLFKPTDPNRIHPNLVIVLVHPFAILGGSQGLLRGIAMGLAEKGYICITFDTRGAGRSSGKATLTGFSEVNDVINVCEWGCREVDVGRVVLVGSSAGAPISGSAVDKIKQVVGYVSLGYPFGLFASILFGRHHKAILKSPIPKLFVMGTRDGFTSVRQLEKKLSSAAGRVKKHLMAGVGHFQMEGPAFDTEMVNLIHDFIITLG